MLGTKDIIVIAIEGNVTIESPINFKQFNDRPDNVTIQSIFIKEIPVKSTLWILILSIIIGFLLLLMVVGGLYKAGFFKRAKKEELEAMKRDEVGIRIFFLRIKGNVINKNLCFRLLKVTMLYKRRACQIFKMTKSKR